MPPNTRAGKTTCNTPERLCRIVADFVRRRVGYDAETLQRYDLKGTSHAGRSPRFFPSRFSPLSTGGGCGLGNTFPPYGEAYPSSSHGGVGTVRPIGSSTGKQSASIRRKQRRGKLPPRAIHAFSSRCNASAFAFWRKTSGAGWGEHIGSGATFAHASGLRPSDARTTKP